MAGDRLGVEIRPKSIRLAFVWNGKTCRETLRTGGKPIPPTPKNKRWADSLAKQIREKIEHGTFVYAEFFPNSKNSTSGAGTTVADQLDTWMGLQVGKESSTLKGYRIAADWWKRTIGTKGLRNLVHSDILTALASEPTWTGKTRNNKVSVLRQALKIAMLDRLLTANPLEGLESSPHQRPQPDPFSLDEVDAILDYLTKKHDPQITNYFTAKFFTGMRTSESLSLRWESIDWRLGHMLVSEAIVLGEHKLRTKTNSTRTVALNSRALLAIRAQKPHTFLADKGGWVFLDPRSGERWVDDWTPREMYWRPALRKLGIRYRSPYQTRHTYATVMLMSGVAPAFAAQQLGHSVEMFLRTYAKWLDGGRNDVEMSKVEGLISPQHPQTHEGTL